MIAPLFFGAGSGSAGYIPLVTLLIIYTNLILVKEPILNSNVSVGIFLKLLHKFEEFHINNFTVNR